MLAVLCFIPFFQTALSFHLQQYFQPLSSSLSPAEEAWLNSLFYKDPPGAPLRKRTEIRFLPRPERDALFLAIWKLKNDDGNGVILPSKYDLLARLYRSSIGKAGHDGPSFPGYHRTWLLLLENALREIDPKVVLAFWDPSVDNSRSAKTVLFSNEFFGTGEGVVTGGSFGKLFSRTGRIIQRSVGNAGKLVTTSDIKYILTRKSLAGISRPSAPTYRSLEDMHEQMRQWVGGDMANLETAVEDPVFIFITAFFDRLFEAFRMKQLSRGLNPSSDYPYQANRNTIHDAGARMNLGSMRNIDGVNDFYKDYYTYVTIPDNVCKGLVYGCRHSGQVCHRNKCVRSASIMRRPARIREVPISNWVERNHLPNMNYMWFKK